MEGRKSLEKVKHCYSKIYTAGLFPPGCYLWVTGCTIDSLPQRIRLQGMIGQGDSWLRKRPHSMDDCLHFNFFLPQSRLVVFYFIYYLEVDKTGTEEACLENA